MAAINPSALTTANNVLNAINNNGALPGHELSETINTLGTINTVSHSNSNSNSSCSSSNSSSAGGGGRGGGGGSLSVGYSGVDRVGDGGDGGNETSKPQSLLAAKRLNSKLILQNMEEVLHIVKKQHREKHRRKKEQKKQFLLDAANNTTLHRSNGAATNLTTSMHSAVVSGTSIDSSSIVMHRKHRHHHRKNDKHHNETKSLPQQRQASVDEIILLIDDNGNDNSMDCMEKSGTPRITNAFEMMMGVRNSTGNSNINSKSSSTPSIPSALMPCKDSTSLNANTINDSQSSSSGGKHQLQEWLGKKKKTSTKRRLEDELRSPYIEKQIEQQTSKRFKKTMVNGKNSKKKPQTIDEQLEINDEISKENNYNNNLLKKNGANVVTRLQTNASKSITTMEANKLDVGDADDDDDDDDDSDDNKKKIQMKKRVKKSEELNSFVIQENNQTLPSSGRPKRSCVNKTPYDYGLKRSPRKNKTIQKTRNKRNNIDNNNDTTVINDQIEIIDLDSSQYDLDRAPTNSPKKLAPLFIRSKVPKPCPDPIVLEARKAFLHSGVPERIRFKRLKQQQQDIYYDSLQMQFPNITHVQQFSQSVLNYLNTIQTSLRSYKLQDESNLDLDLDVNSNRSITATLQHKLKSKMTKRRFSSPLKLTDCHKSDFKMKAGAALTGGGSTLKSTLLPKIPNKGDIVKIWKGEFGHFPTYKCYNILRDKYRHYSNIDTIQNPEQISEAFVMTQHTHPPFTSKIPMKAEINANDIHTSCNGEDAISANAAPNGEQLFSEKYKPMLFEQVLVNVNSIALLKEFLSNWTSTDARTSHSSNSFESEDSSSSSTQSCSLANAVVLLGPISSGKTNSVFTLANDMNFNVLEINAGMKRTGKRIIQELQEATLSHQIRKNTKSIKGSLSYHLLPPLPSEGKMSKKTRGQYFQSTSIDIKEAISTDEINANLMKWNQNGRKSLILIEDADIVFDQMDAGYIDAIYALASTSKRPVIIVATNPNCVHLQRLISQKVIHFFPPNAENVSKFLSILSLIENCPITQNDLFNLYLYNKRDLRKTLLELQFFIQSGGDLQRLPPPPSPSIHSTRHSAKLKQPSKQLPRTINSAGSKTDININANANSNANTNIAVHMHKTLYAFCSASIGQSRYGLTIPLNLHLLQTNLYRLFETSSKLKQTNTISLKESNNSKSTLKRKSRSPKKQWINHAVQTSNSTPLEYMCNFYENLSLAALLTQTTLHSYQKCSDDMIDNLIPHIEQDMAQMLIEKSIEIHLDANDCQLNIPSIEVTRYSLCKYMNLRPVNSKRNCQLDYEPLLRCICRSERNRAGKERRSTRFYHYLRNYIPYNELITKEEEAAICNVFQNTNHYDTEKADDINANIANITSTAIAPVTNTIADDTTSNNTDCNYKRK